LLWTFDFLEYLITKLKIDTNTKKFYIVDLCTVNIHHFLLTPAQNIFVFRFDFKSHFLRVSIYELAESSTNYGNLDMYGLASIYWTIWNFSSEKTYFYEILSSSGAKGKLFCVLNSLKIAKLIEIE
jgi:hypothetical protein